MCAETGDGVHILLDLCLSSAVVTFQQTMDNQSCQNIWGLQNELQIGDKMWDNLLDHAVTPCLDIREQTHK